MNCSESPTNLDIISGPLTILGSRAPSAAASARAQSVFPQPGGPWSSMPGWGIPLGLGLGVAHPNRQSER